jgi:hypothetical protein
MSAGSAGPPEGPGPEGPPEGPGPEGPPEGPGPEGPPAGPAPTLAQKIAELKDRRKAMRMTIGQISKSLKANGRKRKLMKLSARGLSKEDL